MEKHWRSVVGRSVCDYFFEAQAKVSNPADVPPVIPTPHYYLISIYRNSMYFVAVVQSESKLGGRGQCTDNRRLFNPLPTNDANTLYVSWYISIS